MRPGPPWPRRELSVVAAGCVPLLITALLAVLDATMTTATLARLLVLAVLWLAGCLGLAARRLVWQLRRLDSLVQGLRAGDYTQRARGSGLLAGLQGGLNELADSLSGEARRSLETDALLSQLLGALDLAVLIVDERDRLVDMNPAAELLLGGTAEALLGRTAGQLGISLWLDHPAPFIDRHAGGAGTPGGGPWEVRRLVFRRRGRPHRLLVVTDVSRALRGEERHAWRRLIRVLGHEINNSLGSIQSTASLLRERAPQADATLTEGLTLIERRSRALGGFIRGYAELAGLPAPHLVPVEVADLIRHVSTLEGRVPVSVEPGEPLSVPLDPMQLEQALINLVRNAADAALATGGAVRVRWSRQERHLVIEVEDDGPGLAHTENLFVPFFTTKPGGSGVGLALASQIIEAHGGSLRLSNRQGARGALALARLPC